MSELLPGRPYIFGDDTVTVLHASAYQHRHACIFKVVHADYVSYYTAYVDSPHFGTLRRKDLAKHLLSILAEQPHHVVLLDKVHKI
jgi:hypothetical protein